MSVLILSAFYLGASAVIALGYSIFYIEVKLPNGSTGQLLDIMDYISNSVMMPFIALLSTILIGWIMTPDYVIDEMERGGEKFRRKKLYCIMIRYVAPVMMFVLFLQSNGILVIVSPWATYGASAFTEAGLKILKKYHMDPDNSKALKKCLDTKNIKLHP